MMRAPNGAGVGSSMSDYNDNAALGSLTITVMEGNEVVERRKPKAKSSSSASSSFFSSTTSAATAAGGSASAVGDYLWPYVTIQVGHTTRRSSSTVLHAGTSGSPSCVWGEEFQFEGVRATQAISITCHAGRGAAENPVLEERLCVVGDVSIPVIRLPEGHVVEQWYQLTPRDYGLAHMGTGVGPKVCKAAIKLRLFFQVKAELFATTLDMGAMSGDELLLLGTTQSLASEGLTGLDASISSPTLPPDTPGSSTSTTTRSPPQRPPPHTPTSPPDEHSPAHPHTLRPAFNKTGVLSSSASPLDLPPTPASATTNGPPPHNPSSSSVAPTPSNLSELAQAELPTGVVDYFTIFGARVVESTGLPSRNADLLLRFPLQDRPEAPLIPHGEEMAHPFFCFPDGVGLHHGPTPPPLEPQTRTFIMRGESFGVCIYFHRRWDSLSARAASPAGGFSLRHSLRSSSSSPPSPSPPPSSSSETSSSSSSSHVVWAPVCLCLLTRLSLLRPLQQWLVSVYDRLDQLLPCDYDTLLQADCASKALTPLFRSHLVQLTQEVPQPHPGALGIQFSDVLGRTLSLRYPGPGSLPPLSHPLSTLLHAFAPRNVLTLVSALLCEWSVILHSTDLAILPVVALSLTALIYPLKWHLAYLVPLPHELLCVMLESPHAYLMGIHSQWLPDIHKLLDEKRSLGEEDFLKEALIVDCDSGTITKLSTPQHKPPTLPPSIHDHLYKKIRTTVYPPLQQMDGAQVILDYETFDTLKAAPIRAAQETDVRVMFARCLAYLLSGYQDCIFFLDSVTPCFIHERFLNEYCVEDDDVKFMARVVETQSFMSFLQYVESAPFCAYFRSLLQRAYSRATSRPQSPPLMSSHSAHSLLSATTSKASANNNNNNTTTDKHTPSVPKKTLADFQVVDDGVDWLGEPSHEGVGGVSPSMSGLGGSSMAEVSVKLTLQIPPPPDTNDASLNKHHREHSEENGNKGSLQQRVFSFSGEDGEVDDGSSSTNGGPPPPPPSEQASSDRSASLSDASDSGSGKPRQPSAEDAQAAGQGQEGGKEGGEKEGEPLPAAPATVGVRFAVPPAPPERSESNSSDQPLNSPERGYRKRGQAPQPLGVSLLPSPSKLERRSSSLGEFELESMMARLRPGSPNSNSRSTHHDGPLSNRGASSSLSRSLRGPLQSQSQSQEDGATQEVEEEEEEWREARRWTVDEAAEMMGVSVKDVARALGLHVDLQRAMTRGHTVLGFMEAPSSSLDLLQGMDMQAAVGMSHEATHINNCLRYAFSSDVLPQRDLDQAEAYFRLKDVRQRFVSLLNQPRSKRLHYNQRGAPGPAGQFRVHGQGFETLMQLASATLNACVAERDNVTAHTLLQVMGRYYQVQEQSSDASAWSYLRSDAQHKEFLSSRLRHHKIYQNLDVWVNVLKEQLAEEAALRKKASVSATPNSSSSSSTSSKAEPQADPKKLAQRVKLLLMEMHGVGMPDHKAVAFVGRVCDAYKPGPEVKQSLIKLSQKIWKTELHKEMEETQALPTAMPTAPRGLGAGAGAGGGEADGSSEIPGQLKRRVSFSTTGGGGGGGGGQGGEGAREQGSRRHSAFSFNERGGGGGGGSSASVGMLSAPQSLGGGHGSGPNETSTHKGPVLTLDVDDDGSLGVSGGADKLLVVYSIQQKSRITTLTGHSGPVTCTAIFKDKDGEALLASASLDATLRLWKLTGGGAGGDGGGSLSSASTLLARLTGGGRDVRSVLTGHRDGILCMDVYRGADQDQLIVTGGLDRLIKLWSVSQGRNTGTLVGHSGAVTCVRLLDPLGQRAQGSHGPTPVTPAYRILSASHDKTMMQWDVVSGACVRVYRGHEGPIRCLQCWGRGDCAVTASSDRTLRVWDLRVDNSVHKLAEHRGAVTCLQLAQTGDAPLLFSGSTDGTVKVWDLRGGGRCTASLGGHSEAVTCLGLQVTNGVSKVISAGEDRRLVEYDVRSGVVLQSRLGHRDGISALRVCGPHTLITGSWDHTVRLWPSTSSPAPVGS